MTRAEIVQRLAKDLGLEIGHEPPWTYKIATLLEGDHQLVYLDALRDDAPRDAPWTGEVVALTDTRVIRARIRDAAKGNRVTTWGRGLLRSVRVEGSDEHWGGLNDGVAPGTRLRLEYRGQRDVVVPLDPTIVSRTGDLARLLPSLLDDLIR